MTPIRNVSDRERQLCAEIERLTAERDEWKKRLEFSFEQRDALKADAKYWRTAKALNWIEPGLDAKLDAAMKEGAK